MAGRTAPTGTGEALRDATVAMTIKPAYNWLEVDTANPNGARS